MAFERLKQVIKDWHEDPTKGIEEICEGCLEMATEIDGLEAAARENLDRYIEQAQKSDKIVEKCLARMEVQQREKASETRSDCKGEYDEPTKKC